MRYNITKKNSTKQERIVYEVLKRLHIPFKHRWLVDGREIDFLVGSLAIEIDGHEQKIQKNHSLINRGLTPVHLHNGEVTEEKVLTILQHYNAYKA